MNALKHCNAGLKLLAVMAIATANLSVSALNWPTKPLGATISARPMTMLVAGKDHKFFYEAYNDASDIDGDGTLDTHFKPNIVYYGLYDSKLCYQYVTNTVKGQELFEPVGAASTAATTLGACLGNGAGQWSGNWLNYITTSRIDALRKVLYGGTRDVDTTTDTVLRRSYIPQDAHSWGKEFHSSHGYKIGDYTPLTEPTATSKRHFFGNLTANKDVSCATLSNCSSLPPLLRIRTNVGDSKRVYEWASKERPVLDSDLSSGAFPTGTGAEQNFTVRAKVCTGTFIADCKQYGTVFKPVGLLHEYGENESMLFGLLGGSYDQHMSGGRLRKVVSSFANEINPSTGQFVLDAKIVNTFNSLRIRGFNQSSSSSEYLKSDPYADSAKAATEGQFVDWGNPIAEMMYEATRYFSGTKTPTSSFNVSETIDKQVGLSSVTWDDPYESTSAANAPYCSRANFLTISDINPSFDSDSVPGSVFNSYTGDLTGLNVLTRGDTITSIESNITGKRFIGQSSALASSYDAAPTAKTITSLGSIRGLAPEEPTKQGSYYSASVAYHAKTADLRPLLTGKQSIDNYVVALSSPLPRIEAKLPNGKLINVVPFSKSVSGSNISATKGNYQPTNQIVDFYVETIANSGAGDADASVNGGRYYAEFQINFEDVEQGGDHDMDAIAKYVVQANANNTLSVTVTPTYQAGGIQQVMGYVISGTTKDGVYLVARDENIAPTYFLNVPFDTVQRDPGYCDVAIPPLACSTLPTIGSTTVKPYVFTPDGSSASLLRDPLWYAAKYGGFINRDNIDAPNLPLEWDADSNGVPDTYFLVQNPLKLRDALKRAFDNIVEKSGSGGNIIANSTVLSTDALVYQATFNSTRWSGDLAAYPVSNSGVGTNPVWNAAAGIPAATARNIYYHSDTNGANKGKTFTWSSLSNAEKAMFSSNEALFDYVRGVRTQEFQNGGSLRDRAFATVLGDISHSSPVYVKDTNTVYVGANDGMLHAFDSKTGAEIFAHIPSSVMPRLKNLADPNFNVAHEYYVDGDIAVSSKSPSLSNNYLVSTLGRGGKGLFALDVSTPTSFSATDIKWENFDGSSDADLGYMLGRPVIARMNGGTWAVIVGNGYNSTNGRSVLYVFNLLTGQLLRKFDTLAGSDNGMTSPGTFDSNNDGLVDVIYAGDLKGNVWKFDVSSTIPSVWNIANGAQPIFVAKDSTGKRQPITAPMTVAINNVSTDVNYTKRFVFFGTGSYFQTGDPTNTDTQTWYSVIDEGSTLPSAPVRSDLVQRTISTSSTFNGSTVRVIGASSAGDMASKKGCFIDLPAAGERMVTSSRLFSLAENTLIGSSIIPVVDQCVPGGIGYLNAINPFTCARLTLPFFDVNDNGDFLDDVTNGAYIGSIDLGVGMPGEVILVGNRLAVGGSKGTVEDIRVNSGGGGGPTSGPGSLKGRLSWREIVRD